MSKALSNLNIKERMEFVQLESSSCEEIRGLKPIILRELPIGLDKFYSRVLATPEVRHFFATDAHVAGAKKAQLGHWGAICSGNLDERYAANARAIGQTHARIGLEPRWYIGGYAVILEHLINSVVSELWPKKLMQRASRNAGDEAGAAIGSLVKAVLLDMDLAISVYLEAAEEMRIKGEEEAKAKERGIVANSIGAAMAQLAAKDMTYRMTEDMPAAYESLQQNFNAAMTQLEAALAEVASGAASIASSTQEIAAAADDLSRRTEQQAANLEETTAAISEITETVRKTAAGTGQAHDLVSSARADAENSREVVRAAVEAMSQIEKSSQNIGQIIATIDEIAFQTNLLALNAGVEAARAGEAGRGFAVVASEVRALAQRSAEAAREIKGLISASASEISNGVSLVVRTGETLERIATQVVEINGVVSEIASGAKEQSIALQQVNVAISHMDQDTQKNAAMVEETTAASHSLREDAENLARSVGKFQISGAQTKATVKEAARPGAGRLALQASRPPLRAVVRNDASAVRKLPEARSQERWEEF